MRFINRSIMPPPDILHSKRMEQTRGDVREFIEFTQSKGATRRAPETDWMERDPELRAWMEELFCGLCAYCESPVGERRDQSLQGLLHHHRPTSFAQDEDGNTDILAYCWLSYEFENWLYVCSDCARRKGNRFFVEAKRGAPSMSLDELRETEAELMLDPCFQEPLEHLRFFPNGMVDFITAAGHATIDTLGLNRDWLVEIRKEYLGKLIDRLESGGEIPCLGTGSKYPFGAFVFASEVQKSPFEDQFGPHCGANTLALMDFAKARDLIIESQSALDLQIVLTRMDSWQRSHFFDELRLKMNQQNNVESVRSSIAAPPDSTSAEKAAHADRIPNVNKLPNAELPLSDVMISQFKAFKKIDFSLPKVMENSRLTPCMLLLGENATGKSSVLDAMVLGILGTREAAELAKALPHEELWATDLIHREDPAQWDSPCDDVSIHLDFLDGTESAKLFASAGDKTFSGTEHCSKVILAYGPRRFFTSKPSRRFRAPTHRVRSLFDALDMIANPNDWLTSLKRKQFEPVARALRVILMLESEDDIEPVTDEDGKTNIMIRQNGQLSALKDLSVGYKSVIAMACDIMRELLYHNDNLELAHAIVFIDEIETHLHPRWKMQIMSLLRETFPRVQFIVTTHDPLCLRGMFPGEIFVLHRDADDQSVQSLSDLPDIRGMRAEQILTSEFFGLGSTNPETEAGLKRFENLHVKSDRSDAEDIEYKDLQQNLSGKLVVGDTIQAQILNRAVDELDIDPFKPLPKIRKSSRKAMVQELVDQIKSAERRFKLDDQDDVQ